MNGGERESEREREGGTCSGQLILLLFPVPRSIMMCLFLFRVQDFGKGSGFWVFGFSGLWFRVQGFGL